MTDNKCFENSFDHIPHAPAEEPMKNGWSQADMVNMSAKPPSIFRLTVYEYRRKLSKHLHYPSFKLNDFKSSFYTTLKDAEDQIAYESKYSKAFIQEESGQRWYDRYAYVITEIPLGIGIELQTRGESLSERVYLPDGTLWGIRDYCNFIPSFCHGEEYNYWGRLNRFNGRSPEEIRFKPGDIVEVFGFPGNEYWSDNEVNLAIVVECPPTKDQVKEQLKQYTATHSGFDICDHHLCSIFGHWQDAYAVLSESCDSIDHASTISLFKPSLNVSRHRANKLRRMLGLR